eukprot:gene28613-35491_t
MGTPNDNYGDLGSKRPRILAGDSGQQGIDHGFGGMSGPMGGMGNTNGMSGMGDLGNIGTVSGNFGNMQGNMGNMPGNMGMLPGNPGDLPDIVGPALFGKPPSTGKELTLYSGDPQGLDPIDVVFVRKGGRLSGEAYVVLPGPLQVEVAIQSKNRQNLGRRYVEVFRATKQ